MRQIASLWLPHWPIERWMRARIRHSQNQNYLGPQSNTHQNYSTPPGKVSTNATGKATAEAFVLTQSLDQTQKIYAVCKQAQALGLSAGMSLAEVRAIKPDIVAEPAAPDADLTALEGLSRWLVRYTPLAAQDGTDGIMLDISGCPHLLAATGP